MRTLPVVAVLLLGLALAGCLGGGAADREALEISVAFDLQRLTGTPDLREAHPAMSADGSVVAFTRFRDGGSEVASLHLPTGRLTVLSPDPGAQDHAPTVSADGAMVAWVTVADGDSDIAASLADGTGFHAVTRNDDRDVDPALSPDGTEVAYVSTRWGNPEVVMARTDGSGERRLTANRVAEFQPAFSLDGTRLTFISYPEESEIYLGGADGAGFRRVTDNHHTDLYPSLDGAGERLVFAGGIEGFREVWLHDAAHGALVRLTRNLWDEWTPHLTSDGGTVVFRSAGAPQAHEHQIMAVQADGSGLTQLARGQDFAMSADGRLLVVVAEHDLWLLTRR